MSDPRVSRLGSALLLRLGGRSPLSRELLRGGAGSLGIRGANAVLMLALMVVLARVLGADGYGVYSYVLAIVHVLSVPTQLGLQELVVREVAASREKARWGPLSGVLKFAFRTIVVAAAAIALVVGIAAWIQRARWSEGEVATLWWGLLLLPVLSLSSLRGAALRGLKKVSQGLAPEGVVQPLLLLLLVGGSMLWWRERGLAPDQVMLFHVLAASGAFLVGTWFLFEGLPVEARRAEPEYEVGRWLASAVPLALVAGLQMVNSRTGLLLLGYFGSATDVGVYRIAADGGILVAFGLRAVTLATAPHFATLWAAGDLRRFQRLATASARSAFLLALPVALLLAFYGEPILTLVFGSEFAASYAPLTIIVFGQLMNAGFGVVVVLLNMTGNERVVMRGLVVSAMLNLVLSALLIPMWGTVGAAVANVACLAAWNGILWYTTRETIGIESSVLGPLLPVRSGSARDAPRDSGTSLDERE